MAGFTVVYCERLRRQVQVRFGMEGPWGEDEDYSRCPRDCSDGCREIADGESDEQEAPTGVTRPQIP
jgi:hypothetical protein